MIHSTDNPAVCYIFCASTSVLVSHFTCSGILCIPSSFREYLYLLAFCICSFESCRLFFFFSQEQKLHSTQCDSTEEALLGYCFPKYSILNHLYTLSNVLILFYREIPFKAQDYFFSPAYRIFWNTIFLLMK